MTPPAERTREVFRLRRQKGLVKEHMSVRTLRKRAAGTAAGYEKYGLLLLMSSMVAAAAWICVGGSAFNQAAARAAVRASRMREIIDVQETSLRETVEEIVSEKRVVEYEILQKSPAYELSEADYDTLLRIVEAEAGGEDENGKLLVANVVLNRVDSPLFPDTVREVVYQQDYGVYQFSPVSDGRIDRVRVSDETRRAVERAVYGEDISQGALYFAARSAASGESMRWFDSSLTWLFAYGGHEFYG